MAGYRRRRWLRYRPKRRYGGRQRGRHLRRDREHVRTPEAIVYEYDNRDPFDMAEQRIEMLIQRRPEPTDLDRRIEPLRKRFKMTHDIVDGLAALLAQAPRASLAQIQMDRYPRGYRNKEKRLYELIDFNDTLVDTILAMSQDLRCQFAERTKQAADRVCRRVGAPEFSAEQWTAIIRGLTREVAVYTVAIEAGLEARLTDRASDALGIDIQVRDQSTGRYINIDVKTPSSFRQRMEQLLKEGRLTEDQLLHGDQLSYIIEFNGRGKRRTQVIVLCILPDMFGELANWRFTSPDSMRNMLEFLIKEHGLDDSRYGMIL